MGGRVFGPGERGAPPSQVCGACKLFQHDLCSGHPPCDCPSWDHIDTPIGYPCGCPSTGHRAPCWRAAPA